MKEVQDILAVVVLFDQTIEESATLISLDKNDVPLDVLLYDNSSEAQSLPMVGTFNNLRITYLHDPTNPGVSRAYNTAADYALSKGKLCLLLLDQDTHLPPEALNKYLKGINEFENVKLFAPFLKFNGLVYSPCNYFMHKGFHKKTFNLGLNSFKKTNFLNSGLFIALDAFIKAGGYDENIRLYFSDFEFINRFKKYYGDYVLLDIDCAHELASTDRSSEVKALTRFKYYCSDGRAASKGGLLWLQYFITLGLRSFKLAIYFRNFAFSRVFWTYFI